MLLFGREEKFSFCIGFIEKELHSTSEWLIHCLFQPRIHIAYTPCCVLIQGDTESFQLSVDHSNLGRWYQDQYGRPKPRWGVIFYSTKLPTEPKCSLSFGNSPKINVRSPLPWKSSRSTQPESELCNQQKLKGLGNQSRGRFVSWVV